jgi:4-amino-4-deoxy-L-arabinose transferase-like glycosyltransferase
MWAWVLLSRSSDWLPWLRLVVLGVALVAAVLLLLPARGRAMRVTTVAATLIAGLLAPTAFTIQTITTAHTGSIVSAGPSSSGGFGGGTRGAGGGRQTGGMPGAPGALGNLGGAAGVMRGGAGGLLSGAVASDEVSALISADASAYTWAAATVGSNNAASYQLATGDPVLPVGGYNGSDPFPTLAQFVEYVGTGKIHYFIASSIGTSNGGSEASAEIAEWVAANFTAQEVDGVTIYDLTQ